MPSPNKPDAPENHTDTDEPNSGAPPAPPAPPRGAPPKLVQVRMLKTAAGPTFSYQSGQCYTVPAFVADDFIKCGAAESA